MSESGYAAEMHVRNNVKMIYSRMQTLLNRRSKQKRAIEISAPFDLKLEPVSLPGVSQDELTILREKATASRVGITEYIPRSSSSMTSWETRSQTFVYNTPPHAHARRPVW
ncbi:hypothetical protein LMH87_006169 [Akanthomyces muscarius]|uniref:Uncharacterized protein n=2 Tax=Akanthomyces TaxID=150366 RepID=A0A168KDN6_CORDF|nr:hypothetical protein LMH87_006169 [Akanthomyces muscarius]KAJ4164497.1 hypothetical protein LMH87_006169 [Akanthomyces muscarius]OAA81561.1 hypothetical protein LEL_01106 [Akanthomyces lecanii RCEF 1005]